MQIRRIDYRRNKPCRGFFHPFGRDRDRRAAGKNRRANTRAVLIKRAAAARPSQSGPRDRASFEDEASWRKRTRDRTRLTRRRACNVQGDANSTEQKLRELREISESEKRLSVVKDRRSSRKDDTLA